MRPSEKPSARYLWHKIEELIFFLKTNSLPHSLAKTQASPFQSHPRRPVFLSHEWQRSAGFLSPEPWQSVCALEWPTVKNLRGSVAVISTVLERKESNACVLCATGRHCHGFVQGDMLSLGTWLCVNYTKTCPTHPHQVGVEAAQSSIRLYLLAEKYDIIWHTNSKELAGTAQTVT